MELKAPKRKRTTKKPEFPFPGLNMHPITNEIVISGSYEGIFNGLGVTINDIECIEAIYNNGFFGKGSLSRSAPQVLFRNKLVPEIIRNRQYELRLAQNSQSIDNIEASENIIVLPDSDDENVQIEEDFNDLSTYLKKDIPYIKETLLLTLEEAFFLSYAIGCLNIKDESGKILNLEELWNLFNETQVDFTYKYVVYHHFRSKCWVVKSGLKYGSDFLLYKDGPPFYHASYIVTIEIFHNFNKDETGKSILLNRKKISALTRLSITSGKEVLLAQVFLPDNHDNTLSNLSQITVNEVYLKRTFLDELMKK